MPVLTRAALSDSPLADLHALAAELGIDGYRRLRKDDLVEAIVRTQAGEDVAEPPAAEAEEAPRRRRGGRSRSRAAAAEVEGDETAVEAEEATEAVADAVDEDEDRPARSRSRRGGRGRRSRDEDAEEAPAAVAEAEEPAAEERERPARGGRSGRGGDDHVATGTIALQENGSGLLAGAGPDGEDVYVSAAQVRRCELVDGDEVSGPSRAARRSERYPSLVRVETINGRPADQVAPEGTPFEEQPAAFPSKRIALGSDDPTLKAIEWLTPFGRGSRVTIHGPAQAGKSETLRRLAATLAGTEGLEVSLVLAGVRPEELRELPAGVEAAAALAFTASAEARGAAVERALDTARRVAARGGDAVLLVDTLDDLPQGVARRVLGAARDVVDGGSLTVIATSTAPLGGETTLVCLDVELTATKRFPALDLVTSGTLRPELLVGEEGADAIASSRLTALEG